MGWKDKLQKASFRGVPFLWQKLEADIGRRNARHDYPQRDDAFLEDLGKIPREFTMEAYVLGDDYMEQRDRLIGALEEAGPGTLVHPTFGTLRVQLSAKAKLSESTDEGGMARFTLPFILAGDNKYPSAAVDTAATVAAKADDALAAVQDDFGQAFSVEKKPEFIGDAAQDLAQSALDKIDSVRAMVAPPLIPPAVTRFVATAQKIRSSVAALVNTPFALAAELQGFVANLALLTVNPFGAMKGYRNLFGFGSGLPSVSRTTVNRIQQADNQQALVSLVRRTALIEAARASSQAEYPSYQDAIAIRNELADRLDLEMEAATDDATYVALLALRAAMVTDIATRGANLARLASYTPQATLPALVLAYRVYGDASRDAEIVDRNKIRHPGFVPGGRPLEVLTQ